MAGEAAISLVGYVKKEPELRFTPNGDAVCNLTIKVVPRKRGESGYKPGKPSWYRVAIWRKAGEAVAEHVRLEDEVVVVGVIEIEEYEKDSEKRLIPKVTAEVIGVVPKMQTETKETTTEDGSPW
jgi:single-strand DNA-binding protein